MYLEVAEINGGIAQFLAKRVDVAGRGAGD